MLKNISYKLYTNKRLEKILLEYKESFDKVNNIIKCICKCRKDK